MKLSDKELNYNNYVISVTIPPGELAGLIYRICKAKNIQYSIPPLGGMTLTVDALMSITPELPVAAVRVINSAFEHPYLNEEDADWSEEDKEEEYTDEQLGLDTEILGRDSNETLFIGSTLPIDKEPEIVEIGDINAKAGTVLGTGTIIEKTEIQDNPESVDKIVAAIRLKQPTTISQGSTNKTKNNPAPTQQNPAPTTQNVSPVKTPDPVVIVEKETLPPKQLDSMDQKMLKLMQS